MGFEHIMPEFFNASARFPSNLTGHVVKDIELAKFITKPAHAVMIWFEDQSRPQSLLEEKEVKRMSRSQFYDRFAVCRTDVNLGSSYTKQSVKSTRKTIKDDSDNVRERITTSKRKKSKSGKSKSNNNKYDYDDL